MEGPQTEPEGEKVQGPGPQQVAKGKGKGKGKVKGKDKNKEMVDLTQRQVANAVPLLMKATSLALQSSRESEGVLFDVYLIQAESQVVAKMQEKTK
eukprot:840699-Lingulodinium_polyedra.AAC.1